MSKRLTPAALLHLDQQLCFALYSASLAIGKVYKPLLERLNLTYPQYLVMLALWEQDGQTVGALGARLFLDSGTLTPLLKRMEAAGHLARLRDVGDERRVIVQLTAQGRALKAKATDIPACMLEATGCSPTELSELRQRVQSLRDRLVA